MKQKWSTAFKNPTKWRGQSEHHQAKCRCVLCIPNMFLGGGASWRAHYAERLSTTDPERIARLDSVFDLLFGWIDFQAEFSAEFIAEQHAMRTELIQNAIDVSALGMGPDCVKG